MTSTRESAFIEARNAYKKAIKEGPNDETRKIASEYPLWSYMYALDIDKGPHDVTRDGACANRDYAFFYALHIDKTGHNRTRKTVCWRGLPETMRDYGLRIDKFIHPDIYAALSEHNKLLHMLMEKLMDD